MAAKRKAKPKRGARNRGGGSSGKVRVKGHTRTPRGPNKGKKAVRVKGHRRAIPRV
jgi:hypothetical protein